MLRDLQSSQGGQHFHSALSQPIQFSHPLHSTETDSTKCGPKGQQNLGDADEEIILSVFVLRGPFVQVLGLWDEASAADLTSDATGDVTFGSLSPVKMSSCLILPSLRLLVLPVHYTFKSTSYK